MTDSWRKALSKIIAKEESGAELTDAEEARKLDALRKRDREFGRRNRENSSKTPFKPLPWA